MVLFVLLVLGSFGSGVLSIIMPSVNCAVFGCHNSQYNLRKWKKELCLVHTGVTHKICPCDVPFKLYCFPSVLRNSDSRKLWIKALNRINKDNSLWQPTQDDRVCSEHFVDGIPTPANPLPSLKLGYERHSTVSKPRRELVRYEAPQCKKKMKPLEDVSGPEVVEVANNDNDVAIGLNADHTYCKTDESRRCAGCDSKGHLIHSLVGRINSLSLEVKKLHQRRRRLGHSTPFSWKKIKNDSKMNYYTGISSIDLFEKIFLLLEPYLSTMKSWQGP